MPGHQRRRKQRRGTPRRLILATAAVAVMAVVGGVAHEAPRGADGGSPQPLAQGDPAAAGPPAVRTAAPAEAPAASGNGEPAEGAGESGGPGALPRTAAPALAAAPGTAAKAPGAEGRSGLVRDLGSATGWKADGTLPPGRWTVTVEAGQPALGRDEEEITVSRGTPASPTPATGPGAATPGRAAGPGTTAATATAPGAAPTTGPATPAIPATPGTPAAPDTPDTAAADPPGPGGRTGIAVGGTVVAALVGGAFAVLAHRVRRRRDPGRPLSPRR